MEAEYQIDIKVRNALILNKIKNLGFDSVPKFCKANNLSYQSINELLNFRRSPLLASSGNFSSVVINLCNALNCLPEEIFTINQITLEMQSNKHSIQVSEAELQFQLDNLNQKSLDDQRMDDELIPAINKALDTLTPREQKLLRLRFGIDDQTHTLDEIAAHFNCGRERVRQIEAKALRKIRHPSRSDHLRDFLDN